MCSGRRAALGLRQRPAWRRLRDPTASAAPGTGSTAFEIPPSTTATVWRRPRPREQHTRSEGFLRAVGGSSWGGIAADQGGGDPQTRAVRRHADSNCNSRRLLLAASALGRTPRLMAHWGHAPPTQRRISDKAVLPPPGWLLAPAHSGVWTVVGATARTLFLVPERRHTVLCSS